MPLSSRNGGRNTTILVADDEPAILHATAMYLKEYGYNVLTAEDGETALKAFAESPKAIQLVLSDVVMPGMPGPQLVRSIKNLSPSTVTLLMSGTWTIELEDGIALLGKPFTRQKLLTTVRSLLDDCDFEKIEHEQSIARLQRLAAMPGNAVLQPSDSVVAE
jgi:two-component system cell cycle sensor histidine kinase/response regulator CckA